MLQNNDIVITGLQSWDIKIGSTCKNIALSLAKNNRVLYVNPPITRLDKLKGHSYKDQPEKLKKISDNLYVFYPGKILESIGRLPVNFLFDIINRHNNKLFAGEIQEAIDKLGISNFIHLCDGDLYHSLYLKDYLSPRLYAYLFRDNILAVKYWQVQGPRIQPKHMAKADVVLTNSYYHTRIASKHNPNSYFVGQGCDLSMFNPEKIDSIPADLKNIPQPVIGYVGVLTSLRLDIETIRYMAESRPEWNIVLVGPEDKDFANSTLHQISNVHFLGARKPEELASYIKGFDVCMNPQVVNEMTIGNYPLKIDEYLAMGKPVLATHTEAMDYFADYTYLATGKEEYVSMAEKALQEDSEELARKRKEFAQSHSWDNMVSTISNVIEKHI